MHKPLIRSPSIVYIQGEEMTRYAMQRFLDSCIYPHIDTSSWSIYDMSCKNRDNTNDTVLHEAIEKGKTLCSIFKEPTVTPTEVQRQKYGLSQSLNSPNGVMRREWNGFTISRNTIHIDGIELGYKNPVYFERHAIGGEYGGGWKQVGPGEVRTLFYKPGHWIPDIIDTRTLTNDTNAVVTYHNPLDNVEDLAHHFFTRCLEANVNPYVVTKKTVFKWQEPFWRIMKGVFDRFYKTQYEQKGLSGDLAHLISDAATMKLLQWKEGGFGMVAHNYDADMLTDEMAQIHKSPGLITSNLIGKSPQGTILKQFEASHGTVTDLWEAHEQGKETSLNPLGLIEALMGAMEYAEELEGKSHEIREFKDSLMKEIHTMFRTGKGTRDICGEDGLNTDAFIDTLAQQLMK